MSRIANDRPLRQREPRVRDKGYLEWLHRGIPCLACAIEGGINTRVEAAHVKLGIASRGWVECGRGVRPDDARCVPLCPWHHRLASDACDVSQRAFFDRLGLGDAVADFCADLHAAFVTGRRGADVVRRWAEMLS